MHFLRMKKHETILLFGGTSEERRVSVATAQNVSQTLNSESTTLWFMNDVGFVFDVSQDLLLAHSNAFIQDFIPNSQAIGKNFEEAVASLKSPFPVFFFGLHGGEGENGKMQTILERRKISFTGSGSVASHLAFEKGLSKKIAIELGVKIANGVEFMASSLELESFLKDRLQHEGPQILKPVDGGSSIGLFTVSDRIEIPNVISSLKKLGERRYLAENLIFGREVTVGVLEKGGEVIALPASEVRTEKDRRFDYEGKYLGKGSLEITPAEISSKELEAVQKIAVTMHKALGCYGYSRTDMMIAPDGVYYLETNTLPGLTKASFLPQQLNVAQISFKDFVQGQLERAVARNGQS